MKFLLSMPNDQQSNNYIINALQDLGHEIFYVDHRRHLKGCIESVPQIIKEYKPDVFLCLYLEPQATYDDDFIKSLKVKSPNTKFVAWIFDTTIQGKYCDENKEFLKIAKEYDYFFTVAGGQVGNLCKEGVNAYFLPEGFSSYTWDLTGMAQVYDVSFIGQIGHLTVHKDRLPLMKEIIANYSNTIIFGPLLNRDEEIVKHHSHRPTYNDIEHSRIVAQSKINIGHSGWPYIQDYFSARNYRIMGSGGFLLANRTKGIEKFFEEGKEIVLYDNFSDCIDKIKYYLDHEEERKKIARAGKIKVLKNFTFNHSIQKMIRFLED